MSHLRSSASPLSPAPCSSAAKRAFVARWAVWGGALVLLCALAAAQGLAFAASSPHSSYSADTDYCSACHRPHQARTDRALLSIEDTSVVEVNEVALCYVCHAGTGARTNVKNGPVNSFAGSSGHVLESRAATDPAVDLTNSCSSCHYQHDDWTRSPRLPRRTINEAAVAGIGNSWCLACHADPADWFGEGYPAPANPSRDASGYPTAGTFPGPAVYSDPAANAHASIPASVVPDPMVPEGTPPEASWEATRAAGDCLWCHAAHRGASTYDGLLAPFGPSSDSPEDRNGAYAALCFTCHAPGGQGADIKSLVTGSASAGHTIKTAGGLLPVGSDVPCYECHNPHGSTRNNARLLSDTLGQDLDPSTPEGLRAVCFRCHTSNDGYGWDSVAATMTVQAAGGEVLGLSRASGSLRLPAGDYHSKDATRSCAECHGDIHDPASAHDVPDDYRSCLDCHVATDVIDLHDETPSGCDSCHGEGRTPSTDCSTCHPEKLEFHGYDAATHAATVGSLTISGQLTSPSGVAWTRYDGSVQDYSGQRCGQCHSMDLLTEHTKPSSSSAALGCQACHPSPRNTFATWNKTCQQAGCHATIHADMALKHLWSYTGATSWASCGSADSRCHPGEWKPDLAAVHEEPTYWGSAWNVDFTNYPDGCRFCHYSASAVPATPTACTNCHPLSHNPAPLP